MLSYPLLLERQASRLAGAIELPEPCSGKFYLRLVRLAAKGRETVVDVFQQGDRARVRVTRFLRSLRDTIHTDLVDGAHSYNSEATLPLELSGAYLDPRDTFLRLLRYEDFDGFGSGLDLSENSDHYFLFYTNSYAFTARAISDPQSKEWAENWNRLIHRSYGVELVPPRRLFYKDKVKESV